MPASVLCVLSFSMFSACSTALRSLFKGFQVALRTKSKSLRKWLPSLTWLSSHLPLHSFTFPCSSDDKSFPLLSQAWGVFGCLRESGAVPPPELYVSVCFFSRFKSQLPRNASWIASSSPQTPCPFQVSHF